MRGGRKGPVLLLKAIILASAFTIGEAQCVVACFHSFLTGVATAFCVLALFLFATSLLCSTGSSTESFRRVIAASQAVSVQLADQCVAQLLVALGRPRRWRWHCRVHRK